VTTQIVHRLHSLNFPFTYKCGDCNSKNSKRVCCCNSLSSYCGDHSKEYEIGVGCDKYRGWGGWGLGGWWGGMCMWFRCGYRKYMDQTLVLKWIIKIVE